MGVYFTPDNWDSVDNSLNGKIASYSETIDKIHDIILELDARESGCNLLFTGLQDKSWAEICEEAIKLLEQIK